jgi:type II secretory pathway pseudopilin PulG
MRTGRDDRFRGQSLRGASSTRPLVPVARPAVNAVAAEDGYTIIEVLVVCLLLAVVIGALMDPIILGQRTQSRDSNYAYAQQEERTGLDSMVSQIRQATSIISSGANYVQMTITLHGANLLVNYQCDVPQPGSSTYHECVRTEVAAGGTLPGISSSSPVVLRNIVNGGTPVFSWGPDPSAPYYMTATVAVPANGGTTPTGLTHSIWLSDGALMRNLNIAN